MYTKFLTFKKVIVSDLALNIIVFVCYVYMWYTFICNKLQQKN